MVTNRIVTIFTFPYRPLPSPTVLDRLLPSLTVQFSSRDEGDSQPAGSPRRLVTTLWLIPQRPGRAFHPLRESRSFADFPPGPGQKQFAPPRWRHGVGRARSPNNRVLSAVLPCRMDLARRAGKFHPPVGRRASRRPCDPTAWSALQPALVFLLKTKSRHRGSPLWQPKRDATPLKRGEL